MTGQLVQDDGGASAVLGVLLMAAITVTIASVALQINADLEEGPQPPAHVTLWTVPASPQARVMQAD